MNFSIALIARNESKTLPRLIESLNDFKLRGGEILLLDTGSTDNTPETARQLGCKVHEVGERFLITLNEETAKKINEKFIIGNEAPIVKAGDKQFDYASARNYIAEFASNDVIATPDCDEVYTKLDLDKINEAIASGVEQLEYNFVFSHDEFGNEAIKFLHSKFYNRKKAHWVGIIHEVLTGDTKRQFLPEEIIKLEHYQNVETDRSHYLRGLAIDCFNHPDNDRNSHYLGRELFWTNRPKSAAKELLRHINMNRWPAERAQSMIFLGDITNNVSWYHRAFELDSSRREPLIKLAEYYFRTDDAQKTACFAAAALEIQTSGFYADNQAHYTHYPHEMMYWALWKLGRIGESRKHWEAALSYQPLNPKYLEAARYYLPLPKLSIVIPQLGREEGLKRCLDSIEKSNYPRELLEVIVEEGEGTVPQKVERGLAKATGEYIVYAENDTEFDPNCLILAVLENKPFVSFNTGELLPDEGNVCTHFMIRKDVIPGQIFDTDFHHVGVDNLLWAKMKKLGIAYRSKTAILHHHHFSKTGKMDEVSKKGWQNTEEDRKLLKIKLEELNLNA